MSFGVIENFYSELTKINIGNQITIAKFSRIEYHSTKCGSDLRVYKHDVTENLGLKISEISRQQTPSMLVSIEA